VEDAIRKLPGFPAHWRDLVEHMILSHHGLLEFGSPKVPMYLEAMLLHLIDNMDSKMEAMRSHIEKDRQVSGTWTGWSSPLERTVLKKKAYLDPPAPEAAASPAPKPAADSPFAAKLQGALKS
jgi:3'-5' exoribonuclease